MVLFRSNFNGVYDVIDKIKKGKLAAIFNQLMVVELNQTDHPMNGFPIEM